MFQTKAYLTASALALSLALAGCGGGSSSSTPAPSTPTTPPPSTPTPPTATHTVYAAISGLASGASITLRNNTSDTLTESVDGTYAFSQKIAEGASYQVVVQTPPAGQTCTVTNGSGTMGTSDVTADVSCTTTPTHTVGGNLTGLALNETLDVSLNNASPVKLSANGVFTLTPAVAEGASYAVTITTQPTGQLCSITNGTGVMRTSDVTNVGISCLAATYSVAYSFGDNTSASEAGNPQVGGLVADSAGNLYGSTPYGGSSGAGAIFKLTPNGSGGYNESILYDFSASGYKTALGTLVYDASTNALYGTVSTGNSATNQQGGALFEISTTGGDIQILHRFLGSPADPSADGYTPEGKLALDSNGYLYGTTYNGGSTNDRGSVFKIKTDGSGYMILHHFDGNVYNDGSNPQGGVVLDAATNTLYGTTPYGCDTSACNSGTVFKLNTDGTGYSVLHGFTSTGGDGGGPYGTVAFSNGMLYGMTTNGGANDFGTVFSQTTTGSGSGINGAGYTTLYSFSMTDGNGYNPKSDLLLYNGILYGTTNTDNVNYAGTVFKIPVDGNGFTPLHSFTFNPDGGNPQSPLMFDPASGFIFGETYAGGVHGIGSVFRVAP